MDFVPPPALPQDGAVSSGSKSQNSAGDKRNQASAFHSGQEVMIAGRIFRCISPLGKGSYGEVWNCRTCDDPARYGDSVALKEVLCECQKTTEQAVFEIHVLHELDRIQRERIPRSGQAPLRVPSCIASEVQPTGNGKARLRFIMTRLPGDPLDHWLSKKQQLSFNRSEAFKKGCCAAAQLLQDLVPTFLTLSTFAVHRDVNSHNILVHDQIQQGGGLSFWLIDFGLAVNLQKWADSPALIEGGEWRSADIGGDCRYWPASAWMMYLFGWKYLSIHQTFCQQYQQRLDIHGLGITALELLCKATLAVPAEGSDLVSQGIKSLVSAWIAYEESAHSWWSRLYDAFQRGQDVSLLQSTFLREQVPETLNHRLDVLRRACQEAARVSDDPVVSSVLPMLAEMISETSAWGWHDLWRVFCSGEDQVVPQSLLRQQTQPHRHLRTVDTSIPPHQASFGGASSYVPEPSPPMVENMQSAYGESHQQQALPHFGSQAHCGAQPMPQAPPMTIQHPTQSYMPPPAQQPRSYVPPVVQRTGSYVPPVQHPGSYIPPVVAHQVQVPVQTLAQESGAHRFSPAGNETPVPPGWAQLCQQMEQDHQERRRDRSQPPPQRVVGQGQPMMPPANMRARSPAPERVGGRAPPFPVDDHVRNVPRPGPSGAPRLPQGMSAMHQHQRGHMRDPSPIAMRGHARQPSIAVQV